MTKPPTYKFPEEQISNPWFAHSKLLMLLSSIDPLFQFNHNTPGIEATIATNINDILKLFILVSNYAFYRDSHKNQIIQLLKKVSTYNDSAMTRINLDQTVLTAVLNILPLEMETIREC